jgi:hypothetical protein
MTDAAAGPPPALNAAQRKLVRRVRNPLLIRLFLILKLPLGFFAGLRVKRLERQRCETTVPFGWRSQNPFRSVYFAAQAMAAELSTGALAMLALAGEEASIAMLIVGLDAEFGKKAVSKVTFTCEEGEKIFAAVAETVATGEPAVVDVETVGRMADGTEVARFRFRWSFKRRAPRREAA